MHDARDVEDKRLLEAGDHKLLLAGYFHAVRELCFLRLRDREAADEAAQTVLLRLLNELKRGKTYTVPFRVVVWKVVEWTVRGFYPGAKADDTLPDDWDPAAGDEYEALEDAYDFGRLGITRNAVDQALQISSDGQSSASSRLEFVNTNAWD